MQWEFLWGNWGYYTIWGRWGLHGIYVEKERPIHESGSTCWKYRIQQHHKQLRYFLLMVVVYSSATPPQLDRAKLYLRKGEEPPGFCRPPCFEWWGVGLPNRRCMEPAGESFGSLAMTICIKVLKHNSFDVLQAYSCHLRVNFHRPVPMIIHQLSGRDGFRL